MLRCEADTKCSLGEIVARLSPVRSVLRYPDWQWPASASVSGHMCLITGTDCCTVLCR